MGVGFEGKRNYYVKELNDGLKVKRILKERNLAFIPLQISQNDLFKVLLRSWKDA